MKFISTRGQSPSLGFADILLAGSAPDGGYLVPPEVETSVNMALRAISPIRAIAGVRQVSAAVFKKPFSVNGFASGWVGEAEIGRAHV